MKKGNIALIGFRATGKSLIGKILAQKLNRTFVDMDEELVASFGQSIDERVRAQGWDSFREAESELLKRLALESRSVVATGGGIILRASNREILKSRFQVIWLQASPETIYSRLLQDPKTSSQRPALTNLSLKDEIEHLLAQRTPFYKETSGFELATDTLSPSQLVSAILEVLSEK